MKKALHLCLTFFSLIGPSCSKGSSPCPPGYQSQGGRCLPLLDITPHEGIVIPDQGGPEPQTISTDSLPPEAPPDTQPPPDEGLRPETTQSSLIGLPCNKDSDCKKEGLDGVCLDWPSGYCTILYCDASNKCPEGSSCLAITPNATACATNCTTSSDCRPSYGCKAILGPMGEVHRVCFQVKKEGMTGEGCSGPQDCAGDATCLTSFASGYCAVLGCSAEMPCPDGTSCVLVNGQPACLKACQSDEDCKVAGDLPRRCANLKSAITPGEKVKVCASGTYGAKIGDQCLSDMECESEDCEVVFTGKCSSSGQGCKVDGDCPFSEVCLKSPEATFGYCTKECSLATNCPSQTFCIQNKLSETTSQPVGECLPGCEGPGDKACRKEVGLSCLFGDPLKAANRYACARLEKGALGTKCSSPSDCNSNECLLSALGSGYCTSPCGFMDFCPFPTSCQNVLGESRCLLRCKSDEDCPVGHACTVPQGALLEVCWPKP